MTLQAQRIRADHHPVLSRDISPIARIKWRLIYLFLVPFFSSFGKTVTVLTYLQICHMGAYLLHEVSLLSTDRCSDVIEKLLREYQKFESWSVTAVPFLVPTIYTATLAPVPIETLAHLPVEVDIDTLHYSRVLTSALHNPHFLSGIPSFLPTYVRFAVAPEPAGTILARDALLIKLHLSRLALLAFLTLTFLLAVAAGTVAGVVRHSSGTGFGVFGAVTGMVGVVEGYLTWRLK